MYSSIGWYSLSKGAAYCDASMINSEFGVKKAPPWSDLNTGFGTICFVSKSERSIIAILGFALSLIANHFPSYFPSTSESAGW